MSFGNTSVSESLGDQGGADRPATDWVKRVEVLGKWYHLRRNFNYMGYEARLEGLSHYWHFAHSIAFALIAAWDGVGDPDQHAAEVKEAERVYARAFSEGSLA